jgi:hypothetical protein
VHDLSATLRAMSWLQDSEGRRLALPDTDLKVGSGASCALRLDGADVPPLLASLRKSWGEIWLGVHAADPPVAVNGRPVRAMARVCSGDRICFGTFCVDVLGDPPDGRADDACCAAFVLRVRGGTDSGLLQHGPLLHLDDEGRVVSAAAGRISVALVGRRLHLDPDGGTVSVNGHALDGPVLLQDRDQIRIGTRRYIVERTPVVDAVDAAKSQTVAAPPAEAAEDAPLEVEARGEGGSLWWLIGIAALIAALIAFLLYYHG